MNDFNKFLIYFILNLVLIIGSYITLDKYNLWR